MKLVVGFLHSFQGLDGSYRTIVRAPNASVSIMSGFVSIDGDADEQIDVPGSTEHPLNEWNCSIGVESIGQNQ